MKLSELIERLEEIESDSAEGDPDVLISIGDLTAVAGGVEYSPENAAFEEYIKIS